MQFAKIAVVVIIATALITRISFTACETTTGDRGQWKLLKRNLGISAMHMQLLPNDKIVAFDRTDAGPSNISLPSGKCLNLPNQTECTAHSIEFDPSNCGVRPLTVTTETWCSSGALSSDGTLIQTGGHGAGDHAIRYFSPCDDENCDWIERSQGLSKRRWYATNQILPDMRIIVVGGRGQFNYEFVPKNSISDQAVFDLPFLRETTDPRSENNLYPFVHLSTDGNLFVFANTKAILLDYVRNKVVKTFPEMPGGISHNYPSSGSSVLLPLALGSSQTNVEAEIMICGGADSTSFPKIAKGTFLPTSSSCGRLVITDESPEWDMEEMPMGRVMGDMILLPTGDVLIINGAARGTAGWGNAREPVLSPVLYSFKTRKFEVMSSTSIPRLYHSTAHLISDGRVLVGGSNPNIRYEFQGVLFPTELSLEAFYPPYLSSKFNRPSITSIEVGGGSVAYGQRIRIGFVPMRNNSGQDVEVTMVAPSFTTHSFSMNQRVLVLEVGELKEKEGGGGVEVEVLAPASTILAPPGYYMLFVVHGGVPSPGKWIHIKQ